ncbi:MAG TPA: hypothetical protein VLQ79_04535, partial [Myxococcaceae bacterium]|nr:hypothetical protein [Myxococcaceae bacterium]
RPTLVSGRVTAVAAAPGCSRKGQGDCRLWLGAAGGGIWRLENPLDEDPEWSSASAGLDSNAIGSIAVDPSGRGRILYVGTGEQNSAGDSEAGVGLYVSRDGGRSWQLLPASVPFADGLSIASIAVDPRYPGHLYFGTETALHGAASSAGPSLPPNTADLGLFESWDGGNTFQRVFATAPGGAFAGGVMQIELDPKDADTVYVSILGLGLYRRSVKYDGDDGWRPVFTTAEPNDGYNRTVFALADLGKKTRIYVGDSVDATGDSAVYRTDNASVPAGALSDGVNNPGWVSLSSPTPGTPGYASYGFCQGQCFYDIFIATPPGQPDVVWIGGSMNYGEIFTATPPSNGRAVMRSTDAGAHFTDMTRDGRNPPEGMHPDQHAITFLPGEIAFIGSDGGLVRTDGKYVNRSTDCAGRGLSGAALIDCQAWLSAIPRRITSLNAGLTTLQFQSVSVHPRNSKVWMGGTQDNGTWAYGSPEDTFFESIGGDGGQSGFDAVNPETRFHSYYYPQLDVNFRGADPLGWNWISDPLLASGEPNAFYPPMIADPRVGGAMFAGLAHVWRTPDSGGPRAYLEQHCNEYTGDFTVTCGDWKPLGAPTLTGTSFGADKSGGYVIALQRSTGDTDTLWTATSRGRVLVSLNANAPDPASVGFSRVDTAAMPRRAVSGIAIDPADPRHAWVAFTGYGAYTPTARGHVYELRVPPGGGAVSVIDLSGNLGDMPVTALVRDSGSGDLYAGTDFGVLRLARGSGQWRVAASSLPKTAVYGLTLAPKGNVLYAATHGRSVWALELDR